MNTNIRLFGTSLLTSLWLALAGTTATTSVEAANAPASLVDQKVTLNVQEHSDGDPFVVEFHFTSATNVRTKDLDDGEWEYAEYAWQRTGATGQLTWGNRANEHMTISLNFSQRTFTANDHEFDSNGNLSNEDAGSGTFTMENLPEGAIPFGRYFGDDFSDQTTTRSYWAQGHNDSKYGLTVKQDQGNYSLTGTFNGDPDDRWINFGAPSLLSLAEDWVIEGGAFNRTVSPSGSSHNSSVKLGIMVEAPDAGVEFELLIGATPGGSEAHYYSDAGGQFKSSYASSAKDGNYRLRHEKSQETIHCEIQEGSDWRTVSSLNWRTGVYSGANGDSVQISHWQSFENMHVQPAMYFVVPHKEDGDAITFYNIGNNQLGFSSFSVAAGGDGDGQGGNTNPGTGQGGHAPYSIEGATMIAEEELRGSSLGEEHSDSKFEKQTIDFLANNLFTIQRTLIASGEQLPVLTGQYNFSRTSDTTAALSMGTSQGYAFSYSLTFESTVGGDFENHIVVPGEEPNIARGDFTFSGLPENQQGSSGGGTTGNVEDLAPASYGADGGILQILSGMTISVEDAEGIANISFPALPNWESSEETDWEYTYVTEVNGETVTEQGKYMYLKQTPNTAMLSVGEYPQQTYAYSYILTFTDKSSGTYIKNVATVGEDAKSINGTFNLNDTAGGSDDHNHTAGGNGTEGEGFAPETLIGLKVEYHEIEEKSDGTTDDYGLDQATFSATHVTKWDDDDKAYKKEPYTYEKISKNEGRIRVDEEAETYEMNLVFSDLHHANGTWTEVEANGTTWSGTLEFEILGDATEGGDDHNHTETAGGIDDNGSGENGHPKPETEGLPSSQVKDFVDAWIDNNTHYEGAKVMWAEKHHDLADDDNFVYEIGLDNGVALYFDKNKTFLHSALDNEFADHETVELKADEVPQDVKDAIASAHPGAKIQEVEKEFSLEPTEDGQGKEFIYLAIIEKDGEEFEVALGRDAKVHHTHKHEKSDFEEWKEPELPSTAADVLREKYKDGDRETGYWVDERTREDGTIEYVAHLDDEREIIFDANGTEIGVRDPWQERLQQVDAGLKFDVARSKWGTSSDGGNFVKDAEASPAKTNGGNGSDAFVHVKRVETDDEGSMLYRIALMNKSSTEGNASAADFDLGSTVLDANTSLNLTFTYKMGPPRFFAVSGTEVTAFKHRRPEWDKPGSFTIQAKTVDPVASKHNPSDSVSSTFGILVELGGERHHEGAIFVANVIPQDVKGPDLSSPWDPVTGFRLNGLPDANASVKAFLPKQLVQHQFGIWDPGDLKAAIAREDGTLSFIDFHRTPFKGYEPDGFDAHSQTKFMLDETNFGLDERGEGLASEGTQAGPTEEDEDPRPEDGMGRRVLNTENPNEQEEDGEELGDDVENSFIDFDGDGFVDSMLGVSFKNASWPGEIQLGDPWLDPFASINVDDFGSISGSVTTSVNGSPTPLSDFGIWIIDANRTEGEDIYAGKPVFFDLEVNETNGTFVARLPKGIYYVEASAYDPSTDTPYKPLLAGGRETPRTFSIQDANTTLTQDFNLEAEFRVSHEMSEVTGSVTFEGQPVEGLAIEMFPIDENGADLTDHPVHMLFVEHGGKIESNAPSGTFRGEIVSWDNAYNDQNVSISLVAGQLLELPEIALTKRTVSTVSGRITDARGNGTWAEILFVDPDDEDEMTWPMEFEVEHNESTGAPTGVFTAKVPAGSYKILAQRFDGTLLPAYYTSGEGNASGFATAKTVQITEAGVSEIDIRLESRPTATVKVQVVDLNNSPVKYAWFLFHDAEDEEGETVFPEVHPVKSFEADDFNGSYVLKVPGGTYKVEVEADGHEPAFRILNESGNEAWHSTEWEKGAPVTLTDGNTTTLAKATLKAFEKTEAERFGFKWMEHDEEEGPDAGPLPVGASISGTVKTKDGTAVPKARIIAHTRDYLLWLDHVNTRADGSFELKNLPARDDWVVFAEPPFDSEAFRGFRESHAENINVMEANASDVALVLQSSNVYGKILFPRKDPATGETRNAPLAHAHVWAYQDDDGDGEPDFDFDDAAGSQEPITFNEAFGETDEKGIFSFNLQEAGQYALQIDLPGQLSALRPEPISFNVRNPDRDLNLGNAIRLEWKSSVKATSFDIERKASTESSFRSIFSSDEDKPTAKITSFVDISVKPGETYKYQVKAETSKGTITLDGKSVKVSKPFIFLAPPKKTITGYIFDDSNNTVSGAEVVAWREEGEGWSSILSTADGSFELVAGPGKWEVTVYRPHDVKVDWIYDQEPKRVGFKKDSAKESKSVNFTVRKAAGGKVTGRIAVPAGKTWADIYQYVSVDAFDHEGRGNWTDLDLDSNGSFEIPLQPGNYEVSLWVAPELKGFGSSEVKFVRVGKTSVGLEDFVLESRNSKIEGLVKTDSGKALPNVEVWAWSEKGGWVSDVTNVNGAYKLTVSPGQWEVGFELLPAEDGSAPPYLPAPPKRVKLRNDQTSSINFTAKEAGASVKGVVYAAGKAATDLDAWVYARVAHSTEEEFDDIVAEVPIDSRGKFEFPGVPGRYFVGLWMPPGTNYVNPSEKLLELDATGKLLDLDSNGSVLSEIVFNLEANDAVVSGTLKLNDTGVTGLSGEVHAAKGDGGGWQTAPIEDNGTFSMTLSPGRWTLGYFIESDEQDRNLPQHPPEPIEVIAVKGETISKDFSLRSASGTITGSILDENNASITSGTVFVWAHREGTGTLDEFWKEVETDADGNFSIPVLPGGKYEIGAFLPDDLRKGGYLEPKVKTVDLSANVSGLSLSLGKIVDDNFLKGTIRDDGNTTLDGAYVYAWSDDGRVIEGETDENGTYELKVPKGTVWHVGADYGETDDNGSETIYLAEAELDADLRDADSQSNLNLTLTKPDIKVPEGTNGTFDPAKDFVTKLPDGTEVTIPGGAANVPSTETSVRAVVTPTIKGLTKTAKDQPTSYAYSIELFDSSGKKVEGNFKKDVILKIPVDKNATLAKGLDPDNMEAKFYSTTKNSWDSLKSSTYDSNASVIYATTDHFTNIATVSNTSVSALATGLAKIDASGASGDWYNLSWFGNFYDASQGWVYHETHGWLYSADAGSGKFWFYDAELGWFWTGSTYYDASSTSQAEYLYSATHAGWLYFTTSNGKRKFYRYSDTKWINADGTDFTE